MSNAEVLRRTSARIRAELCYGGSGHAFYAAVAEMLDSVARTDLGRGMREDHSDCDVDCDVVRALAIANAFLGDRT
jgi:hypothetical protein